MFFVFEPQVWSQIEEIRPLSSNPVLTQQSEKNIRTSVYRDYRTADTIDLSIPFFDDFTRIGNYPVDSLWMDSNVFVNRSFGYLPPSLGVATFDGLNQFGMPYDPGAINSKDKIADKLTSVPIDMRYYDLSDSIYISFFYQPQGLGDYPEPYDSFALEIKPLRLWKGTYWDSNAWVRIWSMPGTKIKEFEQVILHIPRYLIAGNDTLANFYHKAFQFRFVNYANLAGNVDHWNLDYVFLAKGRKYNDIYYRDLAAVEAPHSLLKHYYSVPWKHLSANHSLMKDNLEIKLRNLYNQPLKARGGYDIRDTFDNDILLFNDNANSQDIYTILDVPVLSTLRTDFKFNKVSTFDKFSVYYQVANYNFTSDDHWDNNYANGYQEFSNYYAYDDGVPEMGYGITHAVHSKVAVKFKIAANAPSTDSLRGLMIFFNQSNETRMRMSFTLSVWDDYEASPIYTRDTITPLVDNRVQNQYLFYEFDSAISVNQTFYIGWEQFSDYFLNIGLDMNYYQLKGDSFPDKPNKNLIYYVNGAWRSSTIPGAPMIRPVFSDKPVSTGFAVVNHPVAEMLVYPNPATQQVVLTTNSENLIKVEVISLEGKSLISDKFRSTATLDITGLPRGIYLLKFTDRHTVSFKKLIKL